MATFTEPQIVRLSSAKVVERAAAFANTVIGTVNYRDGNQTIKQKIRDDHLVSKLGEEAVRFFRKARLRD